MMRRLLALAILVGSGGALAAHAQFGVEPLSITIFPEYPRPFQIITVTPESSLIDLAASTVTISVDGTVVQRGSGKESVNVAVGGPGEATTITVTAVNNGQLYTAQTVIRPADVALVLEPQSTNHPFYEGGSLVASEGNLRIVAIPDLRTSAGAQIPVENLVFTWRNGEQILESASGIGKSVLTAIAPVRYRDTTISVTVATRDSGVVGQASVVVAPVDPIVRIYENDPLLGPRFEQALSRTDALNGEATYRAVPYHFRAMPSLAWSVNGTASQAGQDVTVRPAGSGRGRALLSVDALTAAPRQAAKGELSVTFGSQRAGIFGF